MIVNYKEMSVAKGSKYLGFWWYLIVELALVVWAVLLIADDEYLTAAVIFILIEIREISLKLRSPDA